MADWKTRIFGSGWEKQYSRHVGKDGEAPDWSRRQDFNAADLGDAITSIFGVDRYGKSLGQLQSIPDQSAHQLVEDAARHRLADPTILFLSANPVTGQLPLEVQVEEHRIRAELEKSLFGRNFQIETRPKVIYSDLPRFLIEITPTILHFSGHGTVSGIVVEDHNRQPHLVPAHNLSVLFSLPIIRQPLWLASALVFVPTLVATGWR